MKLVVDANIIISALIATNGDTYDLLFRKDLELFAPQLLKHEISKHENLIAEKAGLETQDIKEFFNVISKEIRFVPDSMLEEHKFFAREISPDENDSEYFSLSLKLKCGIWSNDKKLKEQSLIKIYNTAELLNIFPYSRR